MSDNRRQDDRHPAQVQAQIETDEGLFMAAVTQDVSATGLLLLSHRPLVVGQDVTLHLLMAGEQRVVTGKVVRHEPLTGDDGAFWRAKAAVALSAAEPDLVALGLAKAQPRPARTRAPSQIGDLLRRPDQR